jgi:hypothetical protein
MYELFLENLPRGRFVDNPENDRGYHWLMLQHLVQHTDGRHWYCLAGTQRGGLLKSPLELSYARIPPSYHGLVLHGRGAAGRGVRPRGSGACWVSPYPKSPFVFTSELGAPFTTAGFARMIERAGEAAELDFKAHPHMARLRLRRLGQQGHDTRALQGPT